MLDSDPLDVDVVSLRMQRWLEHAVVGLNLCPFAGAPMRAGLVRVVVSVESSPERMLMSLGDELQLLGRSDVSEIETTLFVCPRTVQSFDHFLGLLELAEDLLDDTGLADDFQLASFHPGYQFADSDSDDPANNSNRAPYPCLHLLRQDSIERAVQAHPDTDQIYRRNIDVLNQLGHSGWQKLSAKWR